MEFLHFGLLPYFLPLAAIPIILHLLTLHRLRTVELSTFRFLFDSYVQQRRRMKFLEALLAFLRTLFLLLVVLSIARPVVKHWDSLFAGSATGRDVVMLIDCSASMGANTDGVSAISRVKRAALEVVSRLGPDDRVTIIRVAAKPQEVCNRFSSDAEAIRAQIERLEVVPSQANLFAAFSHVFDSQARTLNNPLVYLFSDLQATGWTEFDAEQTGRIVPEGTELIVVNVGSTQDVSNRAIVGGAPAEQRAVVGLPITLRPQVANFSETETQEFAVSISIDDKEIARKELVLQPTESAEAEVIFTPSEAGVLRGRYEISSDRFTDDDTFLFTLTVAPQVKVVLVNGHPSVDPLENEGLYLRTAMTSTEFEKEPFGASAGSASKSTSVTEQQSALVRSLDVQDIAEDALNAETIRDADVVILANCGALKNPDQFRLLSGYVVDGGGLIVLPGDKVDPHVYSDQFFPTTPIPDVRLISARLEPPQGDLEKSDTIEHLGAIDLAHPVFAVFGDPNERYFAKVTVSRRFPVTLPEERGDSWPLAEFTNGAPALVESHCGEGRVLLSAFPFNSKWTNLTLKSEFVPLVLQMIAHVKRRSELQGPSVVAADGLAEFVVSNTWAPASAKVTDIAGQVTPVAFQRSNSRLVGAFERTTQKGYYTVDINGGRTEQPKTGSLAFAVNLAEGESDFRTLNGEQIGERLPGVDVTTIDASAEAQQLYGGIGAEREIWRPLILFVFVVIAIEFLLATLGGGRTEDVPSPATAASRIRSLTLGTWVGRMTGSGLKELQESKPGKGTDE